MTGTALPYLALVALATPFEGPIRTMIGFWMIAGAVWWIIGTKIEEEKNGKEAAPKWALAISMLAIAASRTAPLIRWGWHGLGADSGAYRMNFGKCLETIRACAESPVSLMAYPLRAANIPRDMFVPIIGIGVQAFLVYGIYIAAKEMFGKRAALWSIAIFALSIPQFIVYWSLFLNMEVAIALSLLAMVAYQRRSFWVLPGAAAAGIFHFVAFVPLAIAFLAMVVADKGKRKYAAMNLTLSGVIVAAFHTPRITGYAENAAGYALGAKGYGQELFLTGHFMPLAAYHGNLLPFYLPLGLMGIAWMIKRKRAEIFAGYALVAMMLIATRGIFHNRFIILLDIACIIFAGWGIDRIWEKTRKTKINGAAIGMIGLLAIGNMAYQSIRMEPLVDHVEFAEIRAIEGQFASVPIFVNDPVYRQFIEGYSGHPTIAAEFSREPWRLLGKPSLIYNARRSTPFDPSTDPRAKQVSPHFWRYE